MKYFRTFITGLGILIFTSCSVMPKQVLDAMEMQQKEIERVKEIYFDNLNNQLMAIEKYRLAIIDIYEEQTIAQYSKALDMVKNENQEMLQETQPTGDKNLDHINLGKLDDIQTFFRDKREMVRKDIQKRREQIIKANQNFENIEQINIVVNNYLQSLSRLKNSQDKLAEAIKRKIDKVIPIPVSFDNIPDPSTIEDLVNSI
tara:strand:+ start:731 stop:1336 length:606 start_codon:yes stop_codon:yes gene_type:complete